MLCRVNKSGRGNRFVALAIGMFVHRYVRTEEYQIPNGDGLGDDHSELGDSLLATHGLGPPVA